MPLLSEPAAAAASPAPPRFKGSRVAIALVCWVLSGPGILLSFVLAGSALVTLFAQPLSLSLQDFKIYVGVGIFHAWAALAVMTWGWLRERPVHRHWPLTGTLTGIYCLAMFPFGLLLVAPCALLAIYLVFFHLTTKSSDMRIPHP